MVFKCDDIDASVLTWMLLKVDLYDGTFICSTFSTFAGDSCKHIQWYMDTNLWVKGTGEWG